jgi:hypothetical protein
MKIDLRGLKYNCGKIALHNGNTHFVSGSSADKFIVDIFTVDPAQRTSPVFLTKRGIASLCASILIFSIAGTLVLS